MASKYRKGTQVSDPVEAVRLILAGQPLYERNKVQTKGWMTAWPLREVDRKARAGFLSIAILNTPETQK